MKKSMLVGMLMVVAAAAFAGPQTTCPVMGGKINKTQYVDVEGYRIYICCKGCIEPLKAAPAKYIAKLKAEGVEVEKTPEKQAN
jgi:hypothetical protein